MLIGNMFVLEVIPLIAIPRNQGQILSYFHTEILPRGSFVEIEIRKKKIRAIVMGSRNLKELKIKLRKEINFELKPISKVVQDTAIITKSQSKIAFWISAKYYAPLGLCLKAVLPPFFGKKKYDISLPKTQNLETEKIKPKIKFARTKNLLNHYKLYEPLIEKNKNKQILLLVPETTHLEYFLNHYKKFKPVAICSGLKNKDYYEIYKKIANKEPVLIIGTRVATFLPFSDLGLVILDNESNIAYHSDYTPKYDTADLAKYISEEYGADLVINDLLPKIETYHQLKDGIKLEKLENDIELINLVDEIKSGNYSLFSREFKEQKIIIFSPRKGYAPYLLCDHCGFVAHCRNCERVLAVHKQEAKNRKLETHLRCRYCNTTEPILNICPNCKKTVLEYKGLGIQKAIEKFKKFLGRKNLSVPTIIELSNDTALNRADEEKIISEYQNNSPAVIFATQKIFSYRYLIKADLAVILNADILSSFPDFRADEEALREMALLANMARKTVIQAYHPENAPIKALTENRIREFLTVELENRKEFGYPPFGELVKLTYRHRNQRIAEQEAKIMMERLKMGAKELKLEVEIFEPTPGLRERGFYAQEIILKNKMEIYPVKSGEAGAKQFDGIKKRNELLRLVPSNWRIETGRLNQL